MPSETIAFHDINLRVANLKLLYKLNKSKAQNLIDLPRFCWIFVFRILFFSFPSDRSETTKVQLKYRNRNSKCTTVDFFFLKSILACFWFDCSSCTLFFCLVGVLMVNTESRIGFRICCRNLFSRFCR